MLGDLVEHYRLMRKQQKPNWLVSITTSLAMCNILLAVWLILMRSLLEADVPSPALQPTGSSELMLDTETESEVPASMDSVSTEAENDELPDIENI